jgi:serine/threonine protein kinase
MAFPESITGQKSSWSLFQKLGEGDAGEVYLVESLLEKRVAILKRPHRSAFSSDVIRQASQIETEGKILRALDNLKLNGFSFRVETPALLDQGPAGTEFSERFFIVVARAPGFDLKSLARAARFGRSDPVDPADGLPQAEKFFLERLARERSRTVALLPLR